jgi:hypothetical protein
MNKGAGKSIEFRSPLKEVDDMQVENEPPNLGPQGNLNVINGRPPNAYDALSRKKQVNSAFVTVGKSSGGCVSKS